MAQVTGEVSITLPVKIVSMRYLYIVALFHNININCKIYIFIDNLPKV